MGKEKRIVKIEKGETRREIPESKEFVVTRLNK
jgi:hypothetical protein